MSSNGHATIYLHTREFHKLYPNVTYNLNESGGKSIETRLINDQIDIGITNHSYR